MIPGRHSLFWKLALLLCLSAVFIVMLSGWLLRTVGEQVVLLDELNIVLRYDYLDLAEVIETLRNKPEMKHVIVTGRNAKDELIDAADLVTDMTQVKHPFRSGVKAQRGIEF